MNRASVLIIPALNPGYEFISYVKSLISNDFKRIIIINDGSSSDQEPIFQELLSFPECSVLTHAVNMGKGRALKDAFNYYLCTYSSDFCGVITADSDGQHTVEDVIRLDNALIQDPTRLILGVRNFDDSSVPFKSSFGNKLTRITIKALWGGQITDTQTGLRGIPNPLIFKYLTIYGERFEYETTMLIETLRMRVPITEIPIQTVYINNNQETHFRPIQDSIAIYRLIFSSFFRYTLSSVSSFLIDYLLFCLFTAFFSQWELGGRIWISTILSRGISSFYNYNINRHAVFQKTGHSSRTLIRYYALCVLQLCCSSLFTLSVCRLTNIHEVIVKPLIDGILFLFSFQIQRIWVFGGKQ